MGALPHGTSIYAKKRLECRLILPRQVANGLHAHGIEAFRAGSSNIHQVFYRQRKHQAFPVLGIDYRNGIWFFIIAPHFRHDHVFSHANGNRKRKLSFDPLANQICGFFRGAEQVLTASIIEIGFINPIAHGNRGVTSDDLHKSFRILNISPIFGGDGYGFGAKCQCLPNRHACAHAPPLDGIRCRKHDAMAFLGVTAHDERSFGGIFTATVRYGTACIKRIEVDMQNAHTVPFMRRNICSIL